MPKIAYNPKALDDILKSALYLVGEASEETAERFLDAVDESLSKLAEMPLMERILDLNHNELKGVHVWRVKGFEKWPIFYKPINGGIEIIRVLHGSRDIQKALNETEW